MDIDSLLREYEQNHQTAACQVSHAIGIPLIALSLPLLLVKPRRAVSLFLIGWMLQFAGHALEGKPPKFFEGAGYLLVGFIWWLRLVSPPVRLLIRQS